MRVSREARVRRSLQDGRSTGAWGLDLAIPVIAADDGLMPQTYRWNDERAVLAVAETSPVSLPASGRSCELCKRQGLRWAAPV
ncbi:MAG: hypothetical protein E4H20_07110 [Spirochaetales bacterium]|nr:MAG: hypothetical protein E4H20_07110 [Spirochaetales bacterium]